MCSKHYDPLFVVEGRLDIEMRVIALMKEAFKSREEWEAEYPDLSPLGEDWVLAQNWALTVQRQGMVLAHLAVVPQTRTELITEMEGIVDRAPAWLDAHFQGQQVMTLDLFLEGITQTLTRQRAAIERVAAEQVDDPESIEEALAKAPVPLGTEARSDLLPGVGKAIAAHTKALVDLAYDLEIQLGWRSG
jgi:hypothetical protein